MSTTHPTDVVEAYINEVRSRLSDVPEEDRAELLDDVAAHVREIAEEFGPEGLHERLGTPEHFTDELRTSAGYERVASVDDASSRAARARRLARWVDTHVRTDANRATWRKLEPGWFVLRGALAGYVLASAVDVRGVARLAAVVAAAMVSFRLGERRPKTQAAWLRRARVAGELVLVVAALVALDASGNRVVYYESGPTSYGSDPCLRDSSGRPIGNLFAFDPSGQPISQFFLTDQAGRPIQNLCPEQVMYNDRGVETEYARDVNGSPVYGVFPRKQIAVGFDPASGTETKQPVPAPAVVFPQLAPPTTQAPAP